MSYGCTHDKIIIAIKPVESKSDASHLPDVHKLFLCRPSIAFCLAGRDASKVLLDESNIMAVNKLHGLDTPLIVHDIILRIDFSFMTGRGECPANILA